MEYPPRKFHPLRNPPAEPEEGAVSEERARANRMLRTLRSLEIPIFNQAKYNENTRQYNLVRADLIEEVPTTRAGRQRRENMVHFDIDPQNSKKRLHQTHWISRTNSFLVLVNGFELNGDSILEWNKLQTKGGTGEDPASLAKDDAPDITMGGTADSAADGDAAAAAAVAAIIDAAVAAGAGAGAGATVGSTDVNMAGAVDSTAVGAADSTVAASGDAGASATGAAAKADATKTTGPGDKTKGTRKILGSEVRPDRVNREHELVPRLKV
jgi:hypothetical protein